MINRVKKNSLASHLLVAISKNVRRTGHIVPAGPSIQNRPMTSLQLTRTPLKKPCAAVKKALKAKIQG